MNREVILVKHVAEMLGGLNPEHIRQRIVKRLDFPRPVRISGRVILDKKEVAAWIELQKQPKDGRTTQKITEERLLSVILRQL